MFLRQCIRKKDGKEHRYWSIVESKRLNDGRVIPASRALLGRNQFLARAGLAQID
jgi:hypothetical protein